jgi:hypothetical protein
MLSADLVSHVVIGVISSALFGLYSKAPCTTLPPGFYALRQLALDRKEESLTKPILQ